MLRILRWLLVVPVAVVAWYAAVFAGIGLHLGLNALCPADQMVSGLCVAPWYSTASAAVIWIGAALAALFVLLACTWVAPSHRPQAAIATFVVGAVAALVLGAGTREFGPMIAAIAAGAITLWRLRKSRFVLT